MKAQKIFLIVFLFVLGISIHTVYAEKAGEGKIAYVDIRRLFDAHPKTQEYDKALDEKYAAFEAKHKERIEQIRSEQGKLSLLKDDEKNKLQTKIEKDKADLSVYDRQNLTDLQREREEKLREISLEIEKIINDFAAKEGYSLILNDSVLLYGNESLNVTDQVLQKITK